MSKYLHYTTFKNLLKNFGIRHTLRVSFLKILKNDSLYIKAVETFLYNLYSKNVLDIKKNEQNIHPTPPRVWSMWWQGEDSMPEILRICYNSHLKYIKGMGLEYTLITKSNYKDYVVIPDYIEEKIEQGIISFTHFSDLLRVLLIEQYGGTWIDITVLLTAPIDRSLFDLSFYSVKLDANSYNPNLLGQKISESKWAGFILSSSYAHSPLFVYLKDCLLYYWEKYNVTIDYFLLNFLIRVAYKNNNYVKNLIDNMPSTNQNLYKFRPVVNNVYDSEIWGKIKKDNNMFKTTQKIDYSAYIDGKKTLYGYLLDTYIQKK